VGGLLFDSDGVLVDSDDSALGAWRTWATEHDLDPRTVLAQVHGRRAADTVHQLVAAAGRADALRRINELELEAAAQVRSLPGARELLTRLGQVPWAIVTSATRPLATARLAAAGIPEPTVLVTADDVAQGKPAPDGYRSAAQLLGQPARACVVFEDSPAGVLAAHAAGVGFVVGVNLRSSDSETWARVRDLSAVRCQPLDAGGARLTVG
jgi:sugar-phosphatase